MSLIELIKKLEELKEKAPEAKIVVHMEGVGFEEMSDIIYHPEENTVEIY